MLHCGFGRLRKTSPEFARLCMKARACFENGRPATRIQNPRTPKSGLLMELNWRQIWRVAGRESGSPELLGSPRTSPEVPRTSPEVFGDFPGSSLTVEFNSNPEVPRKFPRLSRKFPALPRKFRDFPGGQPLSLGSLTPSPDSQKLALIEVHKNTKYCI